MAKRGDRNAKPDVSRWQNAATGTQHQPTEKQFDAIDKYMYAVIE